MSRQRCYLKMTLNCCCCFPPKYPTRTCRKFSCLFFSLSRGRTRILRFSFEGILPDTPCSSRWPNCFHRSFTCKMWSVLVQGFQPQIQGHPRIRHLTWSCYGYIDLCEREEKKTRKKTEQKKRKKSRSQNTERESDLSLTRLDWLF